MGDDKIREIEKQLRATERDALVVVLANARNALRDDKAPSRGKIAAVEAAKKALDDYDSAANKKPGGAGFDNLSQVADYLKNAGWKVAKKTVYEHANKRGRLTAWKDGKYYQADVDEYAVAFLSRDSGPAESGLVSDLRQRILEADARYKEARAEAEEYKNQLNSGAYLDRATVEAGLAARAHRLRTDLLAWAKAEGPELVRTANGDDDRIPVVIASLTDAIFEVLHRYSTPEGWK